MSLSAVHTALHFPFWQHSTHYVSMMHAIPHVRCLNRGREPGACACRAGRVMGWALFYYFLSMARPLSKHSSWGLDEFVMLPWKAGKRC